MMIPERDLIKKPRLRRVLALIEMMVLTEKAMAGVRRLPLSESPKYTYIVNATNVAKMGISCSRLKEREGGGETGREGGRAREEGGKKGGREGGKEREKEGGRE